MPRALSLAALRVVKSPQYAVDVIVAFDVAVAASASKADFRGCGQKFLQIRNGAQPDHVHVDHHPCGNSSISNLILQAHTSFDKAASWR